MKKTQRILLVVASVLVLASCEVVEGAYNECPAGLVVQADVCPRAAGRLALCKAKGEENGVSAPVGVSWCTVATAPAEGVTDYVECVPVCP